MWLVEILQLDHHWEKEIILYFLIPAEIKLIPKACSTFDAICEQTRPEIP